MIAQDGACGGALVDDDGMKAMESGSITESDIVMRSADEAPMFRGSQVAASYVLI